MFKTVPKGEGGGGREGQNHPSAVVQRHHPGNQLTADGAVGGAGQGLVTLPTGTHMATLKENAGAAVAEADHAGAGGVPSGSEALQHPTDPTLLPVPPVLFAQNKEEEGAAGQPAKGRQDLPEPDARLLPLQQRLKAQAAEVVAQALLGGQQLDGAVVQDQLANASEGRPDGQHLLGLLDAFGPLSAEVVANGVGEGLHRGVESLVDRLQAELCSGQGLYDPHGHIGGPLTPQGHQIERDRVCPLVDDFFVVVPGEVSSRIKNTISGQFVECLFFSPFSPFISATTITLMLWYSSNYSPVSKFLFPKGGVSGLTRSGRSGSTPSCAPEGSASGPPPCSCPQIGC